jgi:hypothetical protein
MPAPAQPYSVSRDLVIRGIKIVDIVFITAVFFATGYVVGLSIDKWFVDHVFGEAEDPHKYHRDSKWKLVLEILAQIIVIAVVSYIGRNVVEFIPFPFHGVLGYDHMRVKELKTGALLTVFIVMFSYNFHDKLQTLRKLVFDDTPNTNMI